MTGRAAGGGERLVLQGCNGTNQGGERHPPLTQSVQQRPYGLAKITVLIIDVGLVIMMIGRSVTC